MDIVLRYYSPLSTVFSQKDHDAMNENSGQNQDALQEPLHSSKDNLKQTIHGWYMFSCISNVAA